MSEAVDSKKLLTRLIDRQDLDRDEVESLFGAIMDGRLSESVVAGLLVALRMKGETGGEVAAAARAMRARALPVPIAEPLAAVDTCGTGGDGSDTINISTAAALVAAAAGVPIAKHGNRSVSSQCGSADVLEALGVSLALNAPAMGQLHDEVGIAFLFAPSLHPAMKSVMPARQSLGVRTVFNLLGPLTNPAGVRRQVVGVWGADVQDLVAEALAELDAVHALVVHSEDGLDELSVAAPTRVIEVQDGAIVGEQRVEPQVLGIRTGDLACLRGGDVAYSADRLYDLLSGKESSAASEAIALNAGAALYVAGVSTSIEEGLHGAREILNSGAALERLQQLARRSQEMSSNG
ncbi:MAG: anthranilate phosphoribosyltransferase [bacterium]|nr:anthranilate phosphoribosyltransferase [bacterium]